MVEIEYSKDEEQGLSFLKSFDDQVGKFDLCGGGFLLQSGNGSGKSMDFCLMKYKGTFLFMIQENNNGPFNLIVEIIQETID